MKYNCLNSGPRVLTKFWGILCYEEFSWAQICLEVCDFVSFKPKCYIIESSFIVQESVCSPPIMFITFFVTLFATVIAITKDLPDVEGDRK